MSEIRGVWETPVAAQGLPNGAGPVQGTVCMMKDSLFLQVEKLMKTPARLSHIEY